MQPLSVWSILSGQEAVMSSRWETLKRGGCALGQTEKGAQEEILYPCAVISSGLKALRSSTAGCGFPIPIHDAR